MIKLRQSAWMEDSASLSVNRTSVGAEQAQRLWSQVFERSDFAIAICIDDRSIAMANAAFARMHGLSGAQLNAITLAEVQAPAARPSLAAQLRNIAPAPSHYSFESQHVRADGSIFPVQIDVTPVRDDEGSLLFRVLYVQDISERKRAEQALRESEARFRAMFDSAAVGAVQVCLLSPGRLLEVNQRYCDITGYSRLELLSMRLADFTHPDDRAADAAALTELLAAGRREFHGEERDIRKDGQLVWVSVAACVICDARGHPLHTLELVQDISERKRSEEQLRTRNETLEQRIAERAAVLDELYEDLRASEERYRRLVELSPDAMFVNQDHHIAYINNAGLRFFGARSRAELVGRSPYELLEPEFVPQAKARTARMLAEDWVAPPVETRVYCLDGTVREVEFSSAPVQFQGGRAIQAICRDIGERKRAERALRATQQRLEFILTSTAAVIYSAQVSDKPRITFVSDYARQMTGYEPRQFLENPRFWLDRVHPEDLPWLTTKLDEAVSNLGSVSVEYRFRCADGSYRWMQNSAQPVLNEQGKLSEFIGYCVDISERKRTQQQLQAQQAEMEALQQQLVIGHTVAAIAHELNQPLNAITSYNEAALRLLHAGNPKPDKLLHALEAGAKQALRAGQTMRDLLAALQTRAPLPDAIDLAQCVRAAIDVFEAESGAIVRPSLDAEESLPRARAVALQVQQIMLNLLHNAAEAMAAAQAEAAGIAVRVGRALEKEFLQVSVHDAGPGVGAALSENIFHAFVTSKPGGVGMGLAISRSLVEAQGGRLWLDSGAPGACFHFTLPIAA